MKLLFCVCVFFSDIVLVSVRKMQLGHFMFYFSRF